MGRVTKRQTALWSRERLRLVDSNIIIYAGSDNFQYLREFLLSSGVFSVSEITRVEVLGYPKIVPIALQFFSTFFASTKAYSITSEIIEKAITLRQQRSMSLGDSIIAATAIINDIPLVTRNIKDFSWIENLQLINPIKE